MFRGITLAAILLTARGLSAQDSRLAARLDKETYAAVSAIVDSARVAKIPTAPLVDKALEGAAKGSGGDKIVLAVRQLSGRMVSVRKVLVTASPDELKAAVTAVDAGVSERDLGRLRSASGKRSVTMPLAVLTDLIGRDVPIPTATNLVLQLARSGVKDPELALFQRNVRADIERGADPSVAATTRARGLVLRGGGPTKPSSE
jgi:hypothetical protein